MNARFITDLTQWLTDGGPGDIVVIINWNTRADIDLSIREPTKEKCFYSNQAAKLGGKLFRDITSGYGPELYLLREAKPGIYQVEVYYFSSNSEKVFPADVSVWVLTDLGKKGQKIRFFRVPLKDSGDRKTVLQLQWPLPVGW